MKKNPWKEIRIESWTHFDEVISELPRNHWVFRGHTDASWFPNTSLYRAFEDAYKIKGLTGKIRNFAKNTHEKYLIDKFQRNAHLYFPNLPLKNQPLEWLAIMQHYGAPTRLLDVTLSPHIAAYFALEKGFGDCAVFAFNHKKLIPSESKSEELYQTLLKKPKLSLDESFILLFSPKMATERLLAQQGVFLVPSNNEQSFTALIKTQRTAPNVCRKIIIPAELRYGGIHRMRNMNLTSTALFPGVDGFCRSLTFQIFEQVQDQKLVL